MRDEIVGLLPEVDALLFDIDGVIMDVAESFPVVVCETAQFYLERIVGWAPRAKAVLPEDVNLFKRAGGFNKDEDLTTAIILFFLARSVRENTQEIERLRTTEPTLEEFAQELARKGGGLMAAEAALLEGLAPAQRRKVTEKLNPRVILQIFREIYGGTEWCERLYGFVPEYFEGPGYVDREKAILDVHRLPKKSVALGVISGRTREESLLILERLRLEKLIPAEHRITDSDGFRKPDPRSLHELRNRLKFRRAIFVGDSLDDLRTVNAYQELPTSRKGPVHSCQVLSGPGGDENQQLFLEAGAEIIAPDVNAFLTCFNHARNG